MSKKHVRVEKKSNGNVTLHFDPLFAVKSGRRNMPPPMKVEAVKKGKSSYCRKEKHKKGYSFGDGTDIFFIWCHIC